MPRIATGNSANRSRGVGGLICQKIYELSKYHRCDAIEAAIFEFNTPMKEILMKNGFVFKGQKEKATYLEERWWSGEHYLLPIS